ncbi:type II toxin-antitoxin system Phd/YefM family antitoxin [Ectothiorhodospira variabilis]|uniref:type II toxin-antitoxin system Phd/YefM family antitoxin n=1 Tax=Ectothiorhodospira variabilis TaxID=505694 RepID=UPI001EFAF60D|nr:type II toxin-antitoxin system prevent-host-death family antitoxin [Ectothiorhodospira variabilis]MCG5495209.1 type II toxin-antitoxin system prevent-host-death family antitoxin [Ectothiorhodospira variabilis]MCG5498463.1 type II toxin-antitoxin system prevent-host-death family antitoxin [Ectothiorhodospira variabilis]MCG5504241.1 type II toxin-antitoxin system prevent-host-death family antitoxin [Ectothiorhodospira variabilis]MCG5507396.1 type II toxin-antitoxin system prevent-host-death fa
MQSFPVVEAKARFSALLAAVEAGEEVVITRRGKVIARLVPERHRSAADVFRAIPCGDDMDLRAPDDRPPEPVPDWN